jgi:probable HAF family extracellular repeat protein
MRSTTRSVLCLTLVIVSASLATALRAYTYSEIKVPGASSTSAIEIDNKGDIAGSYLDPSAHVHGFLLSGGKYTTIDYPGAIGGTEAFGVNDLKVVVGTRDNGKNVKGFRYAKGHFVTFGYPNSAETTPTSINDNGEIVGYFIDSNNTTHGFTLKGKTFKEINVPNSSQTFAVGINRAGDISGTFYDTTGQHGFLLHNHVFHTFDVPGANGKTYGSGLNDKDTLVGFDMGKNQQTLHGFLENQSGFHAIMVPNSVSTSPSSINDSNVIVGGYYLNGERSFLAKP